MPGLLRWDNGRGRPDRPQERAGNLGIGQAFSAEKYALWQALMNLLISPKRAALALASVVAFLTLISFAGYLLRSALGEFLKLISVGSDTGIPAWYSSLALLLCSALLAVIALARRRHEDRYALRWAGLSVVFLYLSTDEMLRLHERASDKLVQPTLRALGVETTGVLNYPWVALYVPLVLVFALAYFGFWFALPMKTKILFLAAGTLFVGGAVGIEVFNALYDSLYGRGNLVAAMMTHLEEFFEMIGVVVFVYALMSYAASDPRLRDLRVGVEDKVPPR